MMLSKCIFTCIRKPIQSNAVSTRGGIISFSKIYLLATRFQSNGHRSFKEVATAEATMRRRSIAYYSISAVVFCVGLTYAAVPLYRLFCQVSVDKRKHSFQARKHSHQTSIPFQSTGYGGTIDTTHDPTRVKHMRRIEDTVLKIRFNADIGSSMRWNFKPQQYEIKVKFIDRAQSVRCMSVTRTNL